MFFFQFLLSALLATAAPITTPTPLAPLRLPFQVSGEPNTTASYIVRLSSASALSSTWLSDIFSSEFSVSSADVDQAITSQQLYTLELFPAFSATLSPSALLLLRQRPDVLWIEQVATRFASSLITQSNAPWHLSRLSAPIPNNANINQDVFEYTFDTEATGEGVDIYVLDTGVFDAHEDFGGRARQLKNFLDNDFDGDRVGHGTHCAGIAAGSKFGLAKSSNIFGIKVMDIDPSLGPDSPAGGPTSAIIAGVDLVVQRFLANRRPSVINMSLGGTVDPTSEPDALEEVIKKAVELGVHVVVAAGNEGASADTASPARVPGAITVGATDKDDQIAGFSNFGDLVDVFAPGQAIRSLGIRNPTEIVVKSGTSMAAPLVAGLAASFLSVQPTLTPAQLLRKIQQTGVRDVIRGVGSGRRKSENLLAGTGVFA